MRTSNIGVYVDSSLENQPILVADFVVWWIIEGLRTHWHVGCRSTAHIGLGVPICQHQSAFSVLEEVDDHRIAPK